MKRKSRGIENRITRKLKEAPKPKPMVSGHFEWMDMSKESAKHVFVGGDDPHGINTDAGSISIMGGRKLIDKLDQAIRESAEVTLGHRRSGSITTFEEVGDWRVEPRKVKISDLDKCKVLLKSILDSESPENDDLEDISFDERASMYRKLREGLGPKFSRELDEFARNASSPVVPGLGDSLRHSTGDLKLGKGILAQMEEGKGIVQVKGRLFGKSFFTSTLNELLKK